ncbi:MAG TPA: AI-2E family transporter [Chitinophagaceae bacterium]|nr:AI-2E family transporter [Chitinophagaceae bacterium]
MAAKSNTTPFYTKLAMVLISLIALGYLAILGKKLLVPLLFSLMFAILLLPLANALEKWLRLPRGAASILSVIILISGIGFILYIVGAQLTNLASDWPQFKQQLTTSVNGLQDWISATFHVNLQKQKAYVNNATSAIMSSGTTVLGATVLSVSSTLFYLVFVLIDTFFLLFYRSLIIKFLLAVFKEDNSVIVYEIVENIQNIIRQYILGLLLEMAIVASVCCIAFAILGIKYAILLGLLTGLFNIIPYIGIFTALLLSVFITFATGAGGGTILIVAVVIIGMHLIDSNLLLPMIVGSKVKINALITILGVVTGEMLWGIPGMFLAIPVIAMTKIIFDRIESLKPWGILLGEDKNEQRPKPIAVNADTGKTAAENVKDAGN